MKRKKEVVSMKEEDKKPMYLSEKERNLIELIRKVGFGEIRIVVNEGVPTRAEEIRKSVLFEQIVESATSSNKGN